MSQPWRKLHRRVTTKWATLSLLARALGTELRRYSDDDDRIELGGLDAPARIARLCGAEPSERRMLPKLIEELSACGYLNVTATDIEIDASVSGDAPSRARRVHENVVTTARELHESSTTTAREVHDNCTTTARELRENCTTTAREQHEIRVKQPESLKSGPVEERREEEKRGEEKRGDQSAREGAAELPSSADPTETALRRGYQTRYQREARDAWMTHVSDDPWIKRAALWCRQQPRPLEAAERFLDGAFGEGAPASWRKNRHPWKWLGEDPGRTASFSTLPTGAMGEHETMGAARAAAMAAIPTMDLTSMEGETW